MVEILRYSCSTSKMKPRISTWVSHNSSSVQPVLNGVLSAWDLQRRGLHPHHWPQSCNISSLAQSNTNKWSCPIAWIWISNLKLHLHSSQSVPNLQFPDVLHPQVGHGICLIAMRQVEWTIKIYSFWPCPIFCLERPHILHRILNRLETNKLLYQNLSKLQHRTTLLFMANWGTGHLPGQQI